MTRSSETGPSGWVGPEATPQKAASSRLIGHQHRSGFRRSTGGAPAYRPEGSSDVDELPRSTGVGTGRHNSA